MLQELSHRGARNAKRHSHVEIVQQLLKMLNIKHKIIFCSQAETSFYLFLFLYWSLIDLQSHVIFRCTVTFSVNQLHSYMYPLLFRFFSHYIILSRVPCAI